MVEEISRNFDRRSKFSNWSDSCQDVFPQVSSRDIVAGLFSNNFVHECEVYERHQIFCKDGSLCKCFTPVLIAEIFWFVSLAQYSIFLIRLGAGDLWMVQIKLSLWLRGLSRQDRIEEGPCTNIESKQRGPWSNWSNWLSLIDINTVQALSTAMHLLYSIIAWNVHTDWRGVGMSHRGCDWLQIYFPHAKIFEMSLARPNVTRSHLPPLVVATCV